MANRFLGKVTSKSVKFMDLEIEIRKLAINQVLLIQRITREAEKKAKATDKQLKDNPDFEVPEDTSGIEILLTVIKEGAPELKELSVEELQAFPMEDLSALSAAIMEFSGLSPKAQPVQPAQ